MSTGETRPEFRAVGLGSHYRNIIELVEDKRRIDVLADALEISQRHVGKDDCDQWTIKGKAGQVQTADDQFYLMYIASYSRRKWGAIKRTAKSFGWEIAQDGNDEGCILVGLPDAAQAKFLRSVLGLRKRSGTPANSSYKEGGSRI